MEVPGRSAFELGLGRFAAGLDRRSVSIPHAHRLPGPEAGVHRGHPSWSCRLSRASLHLPRLFATELASHRAHTRELRVNRNVATYPGGYVRGMAVGRRTETTGRCSAGSLSWRADGCTGDLSGNLLAQTPPVGKANVLTLDPVPSSGHRSFNW